MKITKLMSSNITCVTLDARLSEVRELFIKHRFHHLMVINETGELVGVISERDYLKATNANVELASANNKDLAMLNKRVHQVISNKVVKINHEMPFTAAVSAFHNHGVSCLPIVNDDNKPVGIVTWRDIIRWLYGKVSSQIN